MNKNSDDNRPVHNHRKDKLKLEKEAVKKYSRLAAIAIVILAIVLLNNISIPPVKINDGAFWLKHGVHYMNSGQIKSRIATIDAPYETSIASKISKNTPSCDAVDSGFCQQTPGTYVVKALISPAVQYVAATPDTKQIIGYCTLCRDNTFSPSCAVGRGACSYHGGVAAYDVASYRTIPGKAAVEAKPPVYNYESKSYEDSSLYAPPETPDLKTIANY